MSTNWLYYAVVGLTWWRSLCCCTCCITGRQPSWSMTATTRARPAASTWGWFSGTRGWVSLTRCWSVWCSGGQRTENSEINIETFSFRFAKNKLVSSENYVTVMIRLHLAHSKKERKFSQIDFIYLFIFQSGFIVSTQRWKEIHCL